MGEFEDFDSPSLFRHILSHTLLFWDLRSKLLHRLESLWRLNSVGTTCGGSPRTEYRDHPNSEAFDVRQESLIWPELIDQGPAMWFPFISCFLYFEMKFYRTGIRVQQASVCSIHRELDELVSEELEENLLHLLQEFLPIGAFVFAGCHVLHRTWSKWCVTCHHPSCIKVQPAPSPSIPARAACWMRRPKANFISSKSTWTVPSSTLLKHSLLEMKSD